MRLLKRLFIAVFILFFLLFTSAVVLYLTVKPEQVISILSSSLEKEFGIGISAEKTTLSLLKGLNTTQFVIKDAALSNKILISCSNGSILYNPISFLQGTLDIQRLELSGTTTSWDALTTLKTRFLKEQPGKEKKANLIIRQIQVHDFLMEFEKKIFQINGSVNFDKDFVPSKINVQVKAGGATAQYSGNLSVGSVRIKSLLLSEILPKGPPLLFRDLEGTINLAEKACFDFSVNRFKMNWQNFELESTASFKGTYKLSNSTLLIGNTPLLVNKSAVGLNHFKIDLNTAMIQMAADDSRILLEDLLPSAGGTLTGPFSLSFEKEIKLTAQFQLTNAGFLQFKGVQGNISLENNSLRAQLGLNFAGHPIRGQIEAANVFGPNYSADLSTETLDLNQVLPVLQELLKSIGTNKSAESKPLFRQIRYHLAAETFKLFGFTIDKLDTAGKFENDDLVFDSLTGLWLGGNIQYSGKISKGELTGFLTLEEGKLKTITDTYLTGDKKIYGTFGMKTAIKMPLSNPQDCDASFKGSITAGEMKDFFLQLEISQFLNDVPINDIFFDTIEIEGKLSQGSLNFDKILFTSPEIGASVKGSYGLFSQAFNLTAQLFFTKSYLSDLPNVAQLYTSGYETGDKVMFPLSIRGTLLKPAIEMNKNND